MRQKNTKKTKKTRKNKKKSKPLEPLKKPEKFCENCGTPIPKDVKFAFIRGNKVCQSCYERLKHSKKNSQKEGYIQKYYIRWLNMSE